MVAQASPASRAKCAGCAPCSASMAFRDPLRAVVAGWMGKDPSHACWMAGTRVPTRLFADDILLARSRGYLCVRMGARGQKTQMAAENGKRGRQRDAAAQVGSLAPQPGRGWEDAARSGKRGGGWENLPPRGRAVGSPRIPSFAPRTGSSAAIASADGKDALAGLRMGRTQSHREGKRNESYSTGSWKASLKKGEGRMKTPCVRAFVLGGFRPWNCRWCCGSGRFLLPAWGLGAHKARSR